MKPVSVLHLLAILPLLFRHTARVRAMTPTPEMLRAYETGSGIVVHDWQAVGRMHINRRVATRDPEGTCCSANYTALWDTDGEIIALAVDDFFCR